MKNIDWAKKGIFSFSNSPLALLTTGGMVLLLMSIIMILTFIALRVLFPDHAPEGATSILVSIFVLVLILNFFTILSPQIQNFNTLCIY